MRKVKQTNFKEVGKKLIRILLQTIFLLTFTASMILFLIKAHAMIAGTDLSFAERLDQNIVAICSCWMSITSSIALNYFNKKELEELDKNEKM